MTRARATRRALALAGALARGALLLAALGACGGAPASRAGTALAMRPSPTAPVRAGPGPDPSVRALVARVDRAALERDLRFIARPRHHAQAPAHLRAVGDYLAQGFARAGFAVTRQPVHYRSGTVDNVIGERAGERGGGQGPVVIVCAHYDAVPDTPGADDNASGAAALLALARALAPERTTAAVRLVAFGFEEYGQIGSYAYVRSLDAAARARIAGVFDLEMIGYADRRPGSQRFPQYLREAVFWRSLPDAGDFIGAMGASEARAPVAALLAARAYVPRLPTEVIHLPGALLRGSSEFQRSDHAPFWWAEIPAVIVGDTAELRNPHYHAASDTVDTLDLAFAARVTRWVAAAVAIMAGVRGGG